MRFFILFYFILFILVSCSTTNESADPNVEPDPICACNNSNVQTSFNEVKGSWRLIRRTFLDSTGQNVTSVEEIENLEPYSPGSLSFRIYQDTSGNKIIEKPVGALVGGTAVYDYKYMIVKLAYPIVYFKDGSNCIKTVTTSPNAGFKLCILQYNQNYIKIKQKWSNYYLIYEAYREQ
jgi:hypothetical protein